MTMHTDPNTVKLTQYSHGAGCGCKIAPEVLSQMLEGNQTLIKDPRLLVGNDTRDDAAVYDLNGTQVIISTTDFFMPIVDNPFDFGGIAAVNAISDIYAMGGQPIMAIAILGWPLDKLAPAIAREVIAGARDACSRAGIALAGGHSIDAPEPIFGLAVTGTAEKKHIKQNSKAIAGCELYLTKPLGVGLYTTAQKKGILENTHFQEVRQLMLTLNNAGATLGKQEGITAMTDVTGFGLLGHLLELCEGSNLIAHVEEKNIPMLPHAAQYIEKGTLPGGTQRNYASYGQKVGPITKAQKAILCDPQTSGGLLIAVEPDKASPVKEYLSSQNMPTEPLGHLKTPPGNIQPQYRVIVT